MPSDTAATRTFRAPARGNIIGEHIDYIGGTVLPFACDLELTVTATRTDGPVSFESVDGLDASAHADGVFRALEEAGLPVQPCRGRIRSTIPHGAGLSSSTALEVAIALALTGGTKPPPHVLQRAEQLATGVPCGVMDQTAILESKAGHAILLDCSTGHFEHIAVPDSVGFVVIDTGTRRKLTDGRYAQRRSELEAGHPARRAHALTEQGRVSAAAHALRDGDAASLGALVSASHASLRDDYEVSSPALDAAVVRAEAHPSCFGARLVGAGFAGCVLAVVDPAGAADVAAGFDAAYVVRPVGGASELSAPEATSSSLP
jgi:galactokinase